MKDNPITFDEAKTAVNDIWLVKELLDKTASIDGISRAQIYFKLGKISGLLCRIKNETGRNS